MKSEKFKNGLFIFRRDLRIVDNNSLNLLNDLCENIYTIFIFTPEQVGSGNKYKSDNSVQFMIESLEDLKKDVKSQGGELMTFYGHNNKVIEDCIKALDINVVSFNLDITPYAKKRDEDIMKMCNKMDVPILYDYDYYLHEPGVILNGSGKPYQKFTPYYHTAMKVRVQSPSKRKKLHLKTTGARIPNHIGLDEAMKKFTNINENILVHGGRKEALKLLSTAARTIKKYSSTHNDLNKKTSELSASIKFGCVSIREVYHSLHSIKDLIRQLFWRDFYANILYEFPYVLGHAMKPKYNKIHWHYNANWFKKWCDGETGFPVVDAGMRQLNTTGYMHNRARLIVATFLIKTLLIDWRKGEEYFATRLTDYDPSNNNLNWQWCASSAVDSQPWFRIFNPWRQAEEFDSDCEYIKKWVPELKDVPAKDILKWDTEYVNYKDVKYPKPIANYEEQKEKVLKMYRAIN